jgi:hypothetical protein
LCRIIRDNHNVSFLPTYILHPRRMTHDQGDQIGRLFSLGGFGENYTSTNNWATFTTVTDM